MSSTTGKGFRSGFTFKTKTGGLAGLLPSLGAAARTVVARLLCCCCCPDTSQVSLKLIPRKPFSFTMELLQLVAAATPSSIISKLAELSNALVESKPRNHRNRGMLSLHDLTLQIVYILKFHEAPFETRIAVRLRQAPQNPSSDKWIRNCTGNGDLNARARL